MRSQAEVWLEKYNTAEGEDAQNALREEIVDPSHDQPNVEHITQNEFGGYPFYDFQVFIFPDHSIYGERSSSICYSETYASLAEFADVLTSAHSNVIKNIRALAA